MSRSSRRASGRSSRFLVFVVIFAVGAGLFAGVKKLSLFGAKGVPLAAVDQPAPVVASEFKAPEGQPLLMVPQVMPTTQPTALERPAARMEPAIKVEPALIAPPEVAPVFSGNPLADARARFDGGDLVAARKILNEALIAGQISGSDAQVAKELMSKINQEVVFSKRIFKDDPFCTAYTMQPGNLLAKVAYANAVTWELLCRVNGIADPRRVRALQTLKLVKGPFHAVISKSSYTMDLYLGAPGGSGSMYVTSFRVGLGKDDSTPLGKWMVKPSGKLKNPTYHSPRGEGIIAADDPANPLGEYWIGLAGMEGDALGKDSYGIHGTIEPDSIGKQASMGCIRLVNDDVAMVYELLVGGKSTVIVKE